MYYRCTPRTSTILFGRDRSGHRFSITRKYTQTDATVYSNHRIFHSGEGGGRGAGLIQSLALIVDADNDDH
jgi:hypothetical protein